MSSIVLLALLACGAKSDDTTGSDAGDGGGDSETPESDGSGAQLSGSGSAEVLAIEPMSDGGIVAVGTFDGELSVGSEQATSQGGSDAFVLRLSADQELQWLLTFGGSGDDHANAVMLTSGGDLVVSGFHDGAMSVGGQSVSGAGGGDAFVAVLSASGSVTRAASIGGADRELPVGLVETQKGGYALIGARDGASGASAAPAAPYQPFIEVLTANLAIDDSVYFEQNDHPLAVTSTCRGAETELFGWAGGFEVEVQLGAAHLETSSSGAGFMQRRARAQVDNWTMRLDAGGWTQPQGVACLSDGGFVFAGEFEGASWDLGVAQLSAGDGATDLFALGANQDGEPVWARSLVSSGSASFHGATARDALVVAVGDFEGTVTDGSSTATSAGGRSVLVAGWSSAGEPGLLQAVSSSGGMTGRAVAIGTDGRVWVGGAFEGTLPLSAGDLVAQGGADGYLAVIQP